MSFVEEREMLRRAFASESPGKGAFPRANARIRAARVATGLTHDEVAAHVGLAMMEYWDIEAYEDELFYVVDLGVLPRLASTLGMSVFVMLFGEEPEEGIAQLAPAELAQALRADATKRGVTIEQLSEEVGWDLAPFLRDPESIWSDFGVSGADALCSAVGLDWVRLLA